MSLTSFRIAGVGLISQINDDLSSGGETLVLIPAPSRTDHTTVDNVDSAGNNLVWIQPQPRIEVYYIIINSSAASVISLKSGTTKFASIETAAKGPIVLGEPPKTGIATPIFVCNAGESFTIDGTGGHDIYVQYRIVTPKN